MNTSDEIKINQLKLLNEKEFQKINEPKGQQEFHEKINEVGHHIIFQISDKKNGVQEFQIFDRDIILRTLNFIHFFKVDTQSLFFDTDTNLSYLSAIIDLPNKIFNNKAFDDYCISICQNLFSEKGLVFPLDNYDILISYPNTIEPQY